MLNKQPQTFLWQEIFSLGDKIATKIAPTEEKILKIIEGIRPKRENKISYYR